MASPETVMLLRIEATTRQLRQQMERAEKQLQKSSGKMSKSMRRFDASLKRATMGTGKLKAALGVAIPAVTLAALGKLITGSINAADSIAKIADKTGFTTSQLQELRFAAQQAGVAQNTLDMALQRFSRRVGEAAQGQGELFDTLKQYGIGVLDATGKTRANVDILGDLANAIKGAKSEQEALRIAFKSFDSEGAALVNMLRRGSAGLDQMREKARSLGIVMSDNLVREGEAARSKLDALWAILSAKLNKALVKLAPVITDVAEALFKVASGAIKAFDNFSKWLGLVQRSPVEGQIRSLEQLVRLNEQVLGNPSALKFQQVVHGRSPDQIREAIERTKALIKLLKDNEGVFNGLGGIAKPRSDSGSRLPTRRGSAKASGSTANRAAEFVAEIERRVEALRREGEALNLTGAALETYRFKQQLQLEQSKLNVELSADQRAKLEALTERFEATARANEKLTQAQERGQEQMQSLNSVIDEGVTSGFDALNSALSGNASSWQDWGKSILATIQRVIVQTMILNTIKRALGGIGGGVGNIIGGAGGAPAQFASGGSPPVGVPSIIGERGPELWVPKQAGTIVPNNKLGKMGGDTFYIDATGASRSEFEKFKVWVMQRDGKVEERAVGAVMNRNARALA